jgi:hypothetical protein
MTHHVSFRTSAAQHLKLMKLKATFPDMTWGESFRWLLEEPAVKEVIERRLGMVEPVERPMGGADYSLPVGDR